MAVSSVVTSCSSQPPSLLAAVFLLLCCSYSSCLPLVLFQRSSFLAVESFQIASSPLSPPSSACPRRRTFGRQQQVVRSPESSASASASSQLQASSSPFDFIFKKRKSEKPPLSSSSGEVTLECYRYKGCYNMTYRYLPAFPGCERETPLLLIHPVGIGLASWFWSKFLDEWKELEEDRPAVYAPNLLGCGIRDGSSPVVVTAAATTEIGNGGSSSASTEATTTPAIPPSSLPKEWVESCRCLIRDVILPRHGGGGGGAAPALPRFLLGNKKSSAAGGGSGSGGCHVVAQGGLAPIGILLAASPRREAVVKKLVLTSPPSYKEITVAVPAEELEKNYNFLSSPVLGKLAFRVLESRSAVAFFSNQFLFEAPCDDNWTDRALEEACFEARPPVQVFNAGYCMQESLERELAELSQPTLILQGRADKRQRKGYLETTKGFCTLQVIPGQNVLPYESPAETVDAIRKFLKG